MMSIHDPTKPLIHTAARVLSRQAWLVAVFLILLPWLDDSPVLLGGVVLGLCVAGAVFAGGR